MREQRTQDAVSEQPPFAVRVPSRARVWVGRVALIVFAVFWIGLAFYRFPYVAILPGEATVVNDRLRVAGAKEYPSDGEVLWATVGLQKDVRALDLLAGWLRSSVDIYKRDEILGKASDKEADVRSREEMDDAKTVARVVATRRLGFVSKDGGATIVDVDPDFPAAKVLKVDDVIIAADGTPVCLQGDLAAVMAKKKAGDTVALRLWSKGGAERTVTVGTKAVKGVKRPLIGVLLGPAKDRPCTPPFEVSVNTDKVGGPSAGLAMTLAILDRLSAGELTGGAKIAATGTIEADGSVGPVGGVKQKTAAVRAAGAKLFLVPVEELPIAKTEAGSMQVVGVRSLDDALAALRKAGGEPLPSPSR